jgi:hypothetical protein
MISFFVPGIDSDEGCCIRTAVYDNHNLQQSAYEKIIPIVFKNDCILLLLLLPYNFLLLSNYFEYW